MIMAFVFHSLQSVISKLSAPYKILFFLLVPVAELAGGFKH